MCSERSFQRHSTGKDSVDRIDNQVWGLERTDVSKDWDLEVTDMDTRGQ